MSDDASLARAPKSQPSIRRPAGAVAAVAFAITLAVAASDARAVFVVNQPWVKPGARATEAYMILTSSEGATLVGVRSPIAAHAALRARGAQGHARASLALPPGSAVALRPGADRVALTGLTRALKPGERIPLTLLIETAAGVREEIAVDAEVRTEWPFAAERRGHRH